MSDLNSALIRFIQLREEIDDKISELDKAKKMLENLELAILCAMEDSGLELVVNNGQAFTVVQKMNDDGERRSRLEVCGFPSQDRMGKIEVREI